MPAGRQRRLSWEDEPALDSGDEHAFQEDAPGTPHREPQLLARKQPSIFWHAVSGTLGSILAEAMLFPVDTVKLQVQTASSGGGGFLATAYQILQTEGAGGFYRGLGGAILKESVHSMNFWLWHGFLFRHVAKFDDTSLTPLMTRLMLNLVAKQLNWLCTLPFEVVSSINQLSHPSPGFFSTALKLYQDGGLSAFYRGLAVSLLLAVNPAIMNTLITSLLRVVTAFRMARGQCWVEAREHSSALVGTATALAKALATVVTYPLIRAKVLQQTGAAGSPGRPLAEVLRSIVAAEGASGLYRGVLAMSYKTVLWNSLMMFFKHLLGPKRAMTPPETRAEHGALGYASSLVPLMAREPFPADRLTNMKLDEILSHLKMNGGGRSSRRITTVEKRLDEVTIELREVRQLLTELVASGMLLPKAPAPPSRASTAASTTSSTEATSRPSSSPLPFMSESLTPESPEAAMEDVLTG